MDLGVQVPGAGQRERWQGLKEAEGHSAKWGSGEGQEEEPSRQSQESQPDTTSLSDSDLRERKWL